MKKVLSELKRITSLVIAALVLSTGLALAPAAVVSAETYSNGVVPVTDSNIRYLGHWSHGQNTVKGYFESCIELKFTGTSFKANVSSSSGAGVAVSIDGGDYKAFNAGKSPKFTGLSDGNHKAVIFCEFQHSNPVISSFEIDAGAKTLSPDTNKVMAVIGDSISAGYFEDVQTNSVTHAFSTLVPKKLGLAGAVTAIGGATVVDNANPKVDDLGMINRYFRLGEKTSDAGDTDFNTSSFKPDYILIELGTNDSSNEASVRNAYVAGLKKLRKAYPNAVIFCVTPFMNKNIEAVKTAVEIMRDGNDLKVRYIDAANLASAEKVKSGSGHPSYTGQEFIAESLAYTINKMLSKNGGVASNAQEDIVSSGDGDESYIPGGGIKKKTSSSEKSASSAKAVTASKTESAKNSAKAAKKVTSSYVDKSGNTVVVEQQLDEDGNVIEQNEPAQGKTGESSFMDYIWILIVAVAMVVVGLLVVIFLPQIKRLFCKKG